jgi:putative transposase
LDKSFAGFFNRVKNGNKKEKKAGYPRFKPVSRYNSFTYPQGGFKILPNGHVKVSKIGKLRVFMHRKISGTIKTLTIKKDRVGDWFVIVTVTSRESPDSRPIEEATTKTTTTKKTALGVELLV